MARGLISRRNPSGKPGPYRVRVVMPDGSSRVVSTRQKELGAAREAAKRLRREAARGELHGQQVLELGPMLEAFCRSRQVSGGKARSGCASATIEHYREKSAALVRVLGEHRNVAQLRAAHLEEYIRRRRAQGIADATIGKELVVLRAALKRARRDGLNIDVERVFPEFRPTYQPRERCLTRAEFDKLCEELAPERRATVRFMVWSGARDGEWQRLTAAHVDLAGRRLTLPGTKSAKARRVIPIGDHEVLTSLLEERLALRVNGQLGPLFRPWTNIRRDLHAACKRAHIAPCSSNDLRRTFATWLLRAGVPNDRVARLLGHTTTHMVDRVYGKLRPEDLAGELGRAFNEPTKEVR